MLLVQWSKHLHINIQCPAIYLLAFVVITTPSNLQSLNVPVVKTPSHLLHVTVCSYRYIP